MIITASKFETTMCMHMSGFLYLKRTRIGEHENRI